MSDSKGFIHDPDGIDSEKLAWIMDLKNNRRGRISEYADQFPGSTFTEGSRPWGTKCDVALPCATQNELNEEEANTLTSNGCSCIAEGANMPCTPKAVEVFHKARALLLTR